MSRAWWQYVRTFQQLLASDEKPILSLIETKLFSKPMRRFNWTWTMPTMSYLLARDGKVNAVVEDCYNVQQRYSMLLPPALARYGITFPYVQRIGLSAEVKAEAEIFESVDRGTFVALTARTLIVPSSWPAPKTR